MLSVSGLFKQYTSYDGTPGGGVFGADFALKEGELFTLLGPSGCGKTTTLRSIAGLETPQQGRIQLKDRDLYNSATGANVPMYDRDIGMVFQSYAIWPHMTVFENAAYPLKVGRKKKHSSAEIERKVKEALDMVGLGAFIQRPSTQLSGGQQQRLALARAFTREPDLLLLDEPLSNLDAQLREQMRSELKRLQKETGVTAIYVTHDQSEALAISDRIAVMNEGKIVQLGAPKEIYNRPTSEFVANFIGRTNLIHGELAADASAETIRSVTTALGPLNCFFPAAVPATKSLAVVVRPEHIRIRKAGTPIEAESDNRLTGTLTAETYLGEIVEYVVAAGSKEFLVRTPFVQPIAPGDAVTLAFAPDRTIALIEA
ncbi:MAG TPA: ABC transporter ATP-binding protein [Alphaproteobacteria bacterium]|nr:ABC transporter ATP-binding protein [Alphaproteobacteria bacterium]